jgi:hypothetical protein
MTKRDLLAAFLKILGVVFATFTVFNLATLFMPLEFVGSTVRDNQFWVTIGLTAVFFIAILAIVFVLLRWGDGIARMLERDSSPLPPLVTGDWEKPLFILSLRVAGVVCLISGVPGVIYHLIQVIYAAWSSLYGNISWSYLLRDIVLVVLGAYLLRGGKHVVRFGFREP